MGSRLLPLPLVVGALIADSAGLGSLAFTLVLIAIPCAAGAAFIGAGDALEGRDVLRGVTTCLALALLVLASAVRANAPLGSGVPPLAASALFAAVFVYGLPLLAWVLEPLRPRPRVRARAPRVRTSP
jgi:uncharacterized protein involved in response to NO